MINRLVCKERLGWHFPCKGPRRMTRKPSMGSGTCWRTGWFEVFVIESEAKTISRSAQSSTKHLNAVAILVGRSRRLSWLCLLRRLIVIIINSHCCYAFDQKKIVNPKRFPSQNVSTMLHSEEMLSCSWLPSGILVLTSTKSIYGLYCFKYTQYIIFLKHFATKLLEILVQWK